MPRRPLKLLDEQRHLWPAVLDLGRRSTANDKEANAMLHVLQRLNEPRQAKVLHPKPPGRAKQRPA